MKQNNNNATISGAVCAYNRNDATASSEMPQATNVTWRNPNIFHQIKNNGHTPSGVQVSAGQKIHLDTQAVGLWASPNLAAYDANGIPNSVVSNGNYKMQGLQILQPLSEAPVR